METAYGLRWQSDSIRSHAPEPGEEALIVFTSRPYRDFTAARFARVVRCARDAEAAIRLELELGSRAVTADQDALRTALLDGPNPSEASEVWLARMEAPMPRPPVAYAESDEDERAWHATIARLAADEDYAAAVFLRVAAVRPAEDEAARPLEPPFRLRADRAYLVRVAAYNPHLPPEDLRDAHLVPLYDELATAVVSESGTGIPADGLLDVLICPIVGGPGWLELDVSLGLSLLPAASLGWVAEAPPKGTEESALGQLSLALEPSDPVAEAAVRAFAVVDAADVPATVRLRLLAELRAIAPGEARLAEAEAFVRYGQGDHAAAARLLGDLPLDTLGARGRALLVATTLRSGHLPEPLERVRVADLSRPDAFRLVLEASEALPPGEQVRLSEFVVGRLLSEDRAREWLAALAHRPLPEEESRRLRALSAASQAEEDRP